jgi:hypothetical protein
MAFGSTRLIGLLDLLRRGQWWWHVDHGLHLFAREKNVVPEPLGACRENRFRLYHYRQAEKEANKLFEIFWQIILKPLCHNDLE